MNNSNSTLLNSNAKNFAFQESRNNHMGNFRVPARPPVQPRFSRETSTVVNALQRDNLRASGIKGSPSFTAESGEVKRSETKLTPGQKGRQFGMNVSQAGVSNDSHLYQTQAKNRDSQRTSELRLKNDNSRHKVTRTQLSDKQHREKNCVSSNERGFPPQRHAPYEMSPSESLDNDQQISSHTSDGQVLIRSETGNTATCVMPTLRPYMAPLLNEQFYQDPMKTQTSGISPDEFGMWRCRQCLKTFTQRVLLQMHECPQTPDKPYQCGQCTLSFATPSDLRSHVDTHTNEKLFKCGFCSRAFSGATTLNNHIRTHTGERPFNCEKCHKTFSQASHLARHQRTPGGDCLPVKDV